MGLISRVSSRTYRSRYSKNGSTQVFEDQEGARQGAKAEPTIATMVSIQDQQQDPLQRQATTLEANQARFVNSQHVFSMKQPFYLVSLCTDFQLFANKLLL